MMNFLKREMEHRGMTVEQIIAEKVEKYNEVTLTQVQRMVSNGASQERISSFQANRVKGAVELIDDLKFQLTEDGENE